MNKKRKVISILCVLLITILTLLLKNLSLYQTHEETLLKNDAYIIQEMLKKYPELEEELFAITINSTNIDYSKLELQGISKDSLPYLIKDTTLKKKMILDNILIVLVSFLFLGIIFFYFHQKEKKRIKELEIYLDEILNNNYTFDIQDYEEDDLSYLKSDIYKVTIKLKEAKDHSLKDKLSLQETLSDISHQLKTPLTSMYVMNELLEKDLPKKRRKELLKKQEEQFNRIEWLVSSLLKISMLDSGTIQLKKEKTNLKELVEKAIEPLKIPIELKKLELKIEIPTTLYAYIDPNWTQEAFVNIIKNAYEHTETGKILITGSDNPIYTEMKIVDTGSGIEKEDLNHIFERFYQAKNSKKGSIGIGLNMSKKIIHLESGDINVTSKREEGTTFTIRFYKN